MVESKYWTNTDPKDVKILALTTRFSKLEKQHFCTYNRSRRKRKHNPDPDLHQHQHGRKGTQKELC